MKYCYDLHIHSALSPCGDADMTPNNIVNMALLKGLSLLAVADHNTAGNLRAIHSVAKERLLLIPAIEAETVEEVHTLCYFPTITAAEACASMLYDALPPIENRSDIFGSQLYLDAEDRIIGEESRLLVSAANISIDALFAYVESLGGVCVPAHIDRSSYSILSNLGFLPPELPITALEITAKNRAVSEETYAAYTLLTDSDAHYLEQISEPIYSLALEERSAECFIATLRRK